MRGERLRVAKKKAEKVFAKYHPKDQELRMEHYSWYKPWTEEQLGRMKGIYRKTKVFCSGVCCGNPRRYKMKHNYKSHLTKQEIVMEDNLRWFETDCDEIAVLEQESMEFEDKLDALRIGEPDFYGD